MRVHHLNCISSCPLGGRLMDHRSNSLRGKLACHCLLVESDQGLVLLDTGFGLRDVEDPRARLSAFFLRLLDPDFREELTAVRQIEALGYSASDVQHIVLTHLDFDHAGSSGARTSGGTRTGRARTTGGSGSTACATSPGCRRRSCSCR